MGYILGYIPGMQLHARKSERDVNTANVVGILLLLYIYCIYLLFAYLHFLLSLQKNENGNVVTFSWKSN